MSEVNAGSFAAFDFGDDMSVNTKSEEVSKGVGSPSQGRHLSWIRNPILRLRQTTSAPWDLKETVTKKLRRKKRWRNTTKSNYLKGGLQRNEKEEGEDLNSELSPIRRVNLNGNEGYNTKDDTTMKERHDVNRPIERTKTTPPWRDLQGSESKTGANNAEIETNMATVEALRREIAALREIKAQIQREGDQSDAPYDHIDEGKEEEPLESKKR